MSEPNSAQPGMLRVHVVQPGVTGTVFTGYLSTRLVEDSLPEFVEALKLNPSTFWMADTTRITGFDAGVALTGTPWLTAFKAQGGHTVVTIARSGAVRGIGFSLGFAAGVSMKMVESLEEAKLLLPRSRP